MRNSRIVNLIDLYLNESYLILSYIFVDKKFQYELILYIK